MFHVPLYFQRSDADAVIHVQLIAPLIKNCVPAMCVCAAVRVYMSVLSTGGRGGGRHGQICIEATLHTSKCMIHLFITTPLYVYFQEYPNKGLTDVQPFCYW